ncbi:MAG: DUF3575 domain-containing protein [Bacteroidales bacterium]|nr:DUF3575 domain-containing protein [Bacteroidales bacterium]
MKVRYKLASVLLLFLLLLLMQARAQENSSVFVFTFPPNDSMFLLDCGNNRAELQRLKREVKVRYSQIYGDTLAVFVKGYCAADVHLATIRSNQIKSVLILYGGMREEFFITDNFAGDMDGSTDLARVEVRIPLPEERRAENMERRRKSGAPVYQASAGTDAPRRVPASTGGKRDGADTDAASTGRKRDGADTAFAETGHAPSPSATPTLPGEAIDTDGKDAARHVSTGTGGKQDGDANQTGRKAKRDGDGVRGRDAAHHVSTETGRETQLSVRTNLAYWLAALPNAGIEYQPTGNFGILLNGGWNHFTWKDGYGNLRAFFVQPEVRRYVGKSGQWFVGLEGHAGQFNFKLSKDRDGAQGDFFGAGVTGGYRLRLSRAFDMDFSLGLGYTGLKYEKYYRSDKGVFVRREGRMKKDFWGPTQAGVNLIWKLK